MEVSSKRKLNFRSNAKSEVETPETLTCKRKCSTLMLEDSCNEINIRNGKIPGDKVRKKKNLKGGLKSPQGTTWSFLQESQILNDSKGNEQVKKFKNGCRSQKANVKVKCMSEISTVIPDDKFQGKGKKRELSSPGNSGVNDFKELCSGPFAESDSFRVDYGSSKNKKKKSKKNYESSFDVMQNTHSAKTESLSMQIGPCSMDKKVFLKSKSHRNGTSDFIKLSQKKFRGFEGREDTPERLNRTVFVGNLPLSFNRKLLHTLFQNFGEIESVRIRSAVPARSSLPKKVAVIRNQFHCKSHSFNGYVVFKSVEDVEKALTLNKTVVQGHHIRVDRFKANTDYDSKYSVFVGNLPYDVTAESLWSVFGECGSIEAIRIVRDPGTGLGKGFGFVLFEEFDSVERALLLTETQINGRNIRVKPVEKRNALKQKTSKDGHRTKKKMEKKHLARLQRSSRQQGKNKKIKRSDIQNKKHIMSILNR